MFRLVLYVRGGIVLYLPSRRGCPDRCHMHMLSIRRSFDFMLFSRPDRLFIYSVAIFAQRVLGVRIKWGPFWHFLSWYQPLQSEATCSVIHLTKNWTGGNHKIEGFSIVFWSTSPSIFYTVLVLLDLTWKLRAPQPLEIFISRHILYIICN